MRVFKGGSLADFYYIPERPNFRRELPVPARVGEEFPEESGVQDHRVFRIDLPKSASEVKDESGYVP